MKNLLIPKLQTLSLNDVLPHSWLLVHDNQDEIHKCIMEFSNWLLCINKQESSACGNCKACDLFAAHVHPDFIQVTPPEGKHTIAIDEIRALADFVLAQPQLSTHKIVILYPAETMSKQAANALLKNLEEPRGSTVYFLLTKHQELLLPTIVSRCQVVHLHTQSPAVSAEIIKQIVIDLRRLWLDKSTTTIQIVDSWVKQWPTEVLYCLEVVLTDIIRFKYTQDPGLSKVLNEDHVHLSNALTSSKFWTILERLRAAQYWIGQNQKPNLQLILEDMLLV